MTRSDIKISDYDYALPEERIARFPAARRDGSKLLVYRDGEISTARFSEIPGHIEGGSLLAFNDTKVIRARLVMHKPSGARIEIFCLEPHRPADYERAFAVSGCSEWKCIIGNSKKWKEGPLTISYPHDGRGHELSAYRMPSDGDSQIVRFEWNTPLTFGQLIEILGRIPIPPYLGRDSEELDNERYQTVYSAVEGSVAAPTAGLHFTESVLARIAENDVELARVTLHVGAGTFMPVKAEQVDRHTMHTEHFEVTAGELRKLLTRIGRITAVGTTTVRTLESLAGLGYRIAAMGTPDADNPVGQWELYDIPEDLSGKELLAELLRYMETNGLDKINAATRIMIMPGYRFLVVDNLITNFHQPRSTLLLLISAFMGEDWKRIYDYALENDFRFLSYGDSSILFGNNKI